MQLLFQIEPARCAAGALIQARVAGGLRTRDNGQVRSNHGFAFAIQSFSIIEWMTPRLEEMPRMMRHFFAAD